MQLNVSPPAAGQSTAAAFTSSTELIRWATKPPRANFAGVCEYCTRRNCESDRCIQLHSDALWIVCPTCEGGTIDAYDCCSLGVVQVTEAQYRYYGSGVSMEVVRAEVQR